jgi:hypothetical protein
MSTQNIYMSDLHFEHRSWKSELDFQREELEFFKHRLEEVVPRYTDKTILAKAERFQNKMIHYHVILDELLHEIKAHERELAKFAQDHPIASDHMHFNDHTKLRDKVETQRKIYAEFKQMFFRYLTETM